MKLRFLRFLCCLACGTFGACQALSEDTGGLSNASTDVGDVVLNIPHCDADKEERQILSLQFIATGRFDNLLTPAQNLARIETKFDAMVVSIHGVFADGRSVLVPNIERHCWPTSSEVICAGTISKANPLAWYDTRRISSYAALLPGGEGMNLDSLRIDVDPELTIKLQSGAGLFCETSNRDLPQYLSTPLAINSTSLVKEWEYAIDLPRKCGEGTYETFSTSIAGKCKGPNGYSITCNPEIQTQSIRILLVVQQGKVNILRDVSFPEGGWAGDGDILGAYIRLTGEEAATFVVNSSGDADFQIDLRHSCQHTPLNFTIK